MKTIVDAYNDIIIHHELYPIEYDKGKVVFIDNDKNTCKMKSRINKIVIYCHVTINEYGQTQTSTVELSENDINKLYDKVKSIKETELIGTLPDDDLPF